MPLQGTFDVLDFSEVLRLLARHQLTGRLHVRSRSFAANLFLEEGSLVGADQTEHQAAAASGDVRGRLEEICFEMLDAERGGFEFQPGRPSSLPSTTKLRVDTVLSRARKRLQEWQELQELIPSLDLQPHLVEDLSAAQVTIDQERWRMLTVVDGRRSLRAIGRTLNLSDFDVCRVVKSLLEEGVVELDARATAMASAAREAVAPPVASADAPAVHEVVRVTERAPGAAPAAAGASPTGNSADGPAGSGPAGSPPTVLSAAVPPAAAPAGAPPTPESAPPNPGAAGPGAARPSAPAVEGAPIGAGPAAATSEEATGAEAAQGAGGGDAEPDPAGDDPGAGLRGRRRRVVRIRTRSGRED